MGRSHASNSAPSSVVRMRRRIASDERNSERTTSAPIVREIWRNGASETPAIGARMSGKGCADGKGNCIWQDYLQRLARATYGGDCSDRSYRLPRYNVIS